MSTLEHGRWENIISTLRSGNVSHGKSCGKKWLSCRCSRCYHFTDSFCEKGKERERKRERSVGSRIPKERRQERSRSDAVYFPRCCAESGSPNRARKRKKTKNNPGAEWGEYLPFERDRHSNDILARSLDSIFFSISVECARKCKNGQTFQKKLTSRDMDINSYINQLSSV